MEPGWQRNLFLGVVGVLWVVGNGLLELDDGGEFMDGIVQGLWLSAWILVIVVTDHLIRSMALRFLALAVSLVAISAVEQLITNGRATWTAAAWAVGVAAVVTIVQSIVAVSRRPTAT